MSFMKARQEMIAHFKTQGSAGLDIEDRRTGKSTGNALADIGWCLTNPEKDLRITDHFSNEPNIIVRHALPLRMDLVQKLGLEGFTFDRKNLTMTYSLKP